ncbi:MAG: tetraacyldisaccharide 4'-kinase [Planctomycetaceae bacterium]
MRGVLSAAVPFYLGAVNLRNWAYRAGWRTVHRVEAPVVSIGNLTTGGTGKTPVVAWVVEQLGLLDQQVGILSRGYAQLDSGANDERLVLDRLCPGIPHIQNPDRATAAKQAIDTHGCTVLVLDDGFQHRRLGRSLDVVLIDALCPWGYGSVLPRGLLREPARGLNRADIVALTRVDQVDAEQLDLLRREVQSLTDAPLVEIVFRPISLIDVNGRRRPLSDLQQTNLGACCGIGNPQSFLRTLTALGTPPTRDRFRSFPDHHHYTPADMAQLATWVRQHGIQTVVVTQKDLVKLPETHIGRATVWAVEIGVVIEAGESLLTERLRQTVDRSGKTPP